MSGALVSGALVSGVFASLRDVELEIVRWISCRMRGDVADLVASYVNDLVSGLAVYVLLFLLPLLTARGRARFPRVVVTLLLAMGLVHGVRTILWTVTPRDRPGNTFREDQKLIGPLQRETCEAHPEMWVERGYRSKSSSFPSSHVVTGGACAAALTVASPWLGALGWAYAAAEGWGRLYWGKHWPSDVVGSLVLAAFLGALARRAAPRVLVLLAALRARRSAPSRRPPPSDAPGSPGAIGSPTAGLAGPSTTSLPPPTSPPRESRARE